MTTQQYTNMLIPLIRFRWTKRAKDSSFIDLYTGSVHLGHISHCLTEPEPFNNFGIASANVVADLETLKSNMETDYLRYLQEVTGIWFKNEREWKEKILKEKK